MSLKGIILEVSRGSDLPIRAGFFDHGMAAKFSIGFNIGGGILQHSIRMERIIRRRFVVAIAEGVGGSVRIRIEFLFRHTIEGRQQFQGEVLQLAIITIDFPFQLVRQVGGNCQHAARAKGGSREAAWFVMDGWQGYVIGGQIPVFEPNPQIHRLGPIKDRGVQYKIIRASWPENILAGGVGGEVGELHLVVIESLAAFIMITGLAPGGAFVDVLNFTAIAIGHVFQVQPTFIGEVHIRQAGTVGIEFLDFSQGKGFPTRAPGIGIEDYIPIRKLIFAHNGGVIKNPDLI